MRREKVERNRWLFDKFLWRVEDEGSFPKTAGKFRWSRASLAASLCLRSISLDLFKEF